MEEGGFFIMGPTNDCHFFDKDWNSLRKEYLDNGLTLSNKSMLRAKKDIEGDAKWVYTPSYSKLALRSYKNSLFYNINAEHPNFNALTERQKVLKDGRIIAKVDLKNSKLTNVIGRLSPVYSKYKLPQFMLTSFDITNKGEFYVCYEVDPTIYLYDKDYNILKAFGYSGKNMNTNYEELDKLSEVRKKYNQQREECGYYNWIEFIDETNTLFRSYTKGKTEKSDGLQIYKDGVLIADVDVPKGFKVSAYIAPYYYSDVISDLESEFLKLYKFKLNIN